MKTIQKAITLVGRIISLSVIILLSLSINAQVCFNNNTIDLYDEDDIGAVPTEFTEVGDKVFFSARADMGERELFFYDCTDGTTTMIDVLTGPLGSNPQFLTAIDNKVLFRGSIPFMGVELMVYNCTSGNTDIIDVNPGSGSSFPDDFTVVGNKLFYTASDGTGDEVWVYDCADGSNEKIDVNPGATSGPGFLVAIENKLFFRADDGTNGLEPWVYDCSDGSLSMIEVEPGPGPSTPGGFTGVGDKVFFIASNSTVGRELFIYDCITGTLSAEDINSGIDDSDPANFQALGTDKLIYTAFNGTDSENIWVYDCGASTNTPLGLIKGFLEPVFTEVCGKVIMEATDDDMGSDFQLWAYDCADGSIEMIFEAHSLSDGFVAFDDKFFFSSGGATWSYDCSTEMTEMLDYDGVTPFDLRLSSPVYIDGKFINSINSTDTGTELGIYDCATGELTIADIEPGPDNSSPADMAVINGKVFYRTDNTSYGREMQILECSQCLDISVTDPCDCNDPLNTEIGGLEFFHDVLTVTASPGLSMTLSAVDGNIYDGMGNPLSIGTAISEFAIGSGVYTLDFYSVVGVPSTISISDGISDEEFSTSTCVPCVAIPTLGEWAIVCLGLLMLILGLVTMRSRSYQSA